MKKKLTVTIGIPAYNEEQNIKELLRCLLRQTKECYKLKKIFVISDGSTDATASLAVSLNNSLITVIEHKNRLGQQVAQNFLLGLNKSDILILLEADTLPLHDHVLDALVEPFTKTKSLKKPLGMVIGVPVPMFPKCLFEAILVQGSKIKNEIIFRWKKGNNIYVHSGHAMKALSKQFAKKLSILLTFLRMHLPIYL
jgi:cellulose synthase/poly-beta-1,6-N-acetylglucosamine synthase-like glycosyltransferase